MSARPKWSIVLDALHTGVPVTLFGYEDVRLDEGGALYITRTATCTQTGETSERHLAVDVSLRDFLRECQKLSDEEILSIGASTALTQHRRSERDGRRR